MNTVIRTHVKNEHRLKVLSQTISSWFQKELYRLGDLYIVDDGSPMQKELIECVSHYKCTYVRTTGTPDTKNGLYWSLKVQNQFPVFCTVDDCVFGKGIVDVLSDVLSNGIKYLPNRTGLIGTFACYEDQTRIQNTITGSGVWRIHDSILYALVAHIFTETLASTLINQWEMVQKNEYPYPEMCDDLWVANVCSQNNFTCYNTIKDYAQHTGMNLRTFGNQVDPGSEYYSKMFVGE